MNAVEALVSRIQGLSGSRSDLSLLLGYLRQAEETLFSESTRLTPFLDHLDPSLHSLGYLFFLDACTSGPMSKEQAQSLTGSRSDLSLLLGYLRQAEETLFSKSTRLTPFLDHLDPSLHSLGYLFFLDACTSGPMSKEQAQSLTVVFARFIASCSAEQIRLAPDKFILVCKRYKDQVMLLDAPLREVAPLLTTLQKFQSSSEHLTPLHPEFLQLCLLAKCYKTGLSILEDDIF